MASGGRGLKNMAAPVVLVPECGAGIGFGHLERMLALADALREQVEPVVVTVAEASVVERVRNRGHVALPLAGSAPDRAMRAVVECAARLVVLDGYVFPAGVQTAIRGSCPLVVVDDLDGPCDCDVAVNPAPGVEDSPGPTGASATLRGPAFALLAAAYRTARDQRMREPHSATSLLVSNGGSDLGSIGVPLAHALLTCSVDGRVDLVIGPGATTPLDHPRVTLHRSPTTLASLLAQAALYAGAAGTTAVQAACVGVPAIIAPVADNQRRQAGALERAGCAVVVSPPIDERVAQSACRLLSDRERLQAMSRAGWELVDGRGSERVAAAIAEVLSARAM
jgi:spore coat polysaccharide biosynthesis predicted glycosyltransferase SpsG